MFLSMVGGEKIVAGSNLIPVWIFTLYGSMNKFEDGLDAGSFKE